MCLILQLFGCHSNIITRVEPWPWHTTNSSHVNLMATITTQHLRAPQVQKVPTLSPGCKYTGGSRTYPTPVSAGTWSSRNDTGMSGNKLPYFQTHVFGFVRFISVYHCSHNRRCLMTYKSEIFHDFIWAAFKTPVGWWWVGGWVHNQYMRGISHTMNGEPQSITVLIIGHNNVPNYYTII